MNESLEVDKGVYPALFQEKDRETGRPQGGVSFVIWQWPLTDSPCFG